VGGSFFVRPSLMVDGNVIENTYVHWFFNFFSIFKVNYVNERTKEKSFKK
jgi:hypothetical protein